MRRAAFFAFGAALVPLACFNLDGFSGGTPNTPASPDGGDAATPVVEPEAAVEAASSADGTGATSTDPYGDAVMADAPSAYYRLEDDSTTSTIADATGRHPGRVVGGMTLGVPGVVGHAATFSANGGFDIGDVFSFDGTSELTIEFWGQNENPTDDYESALFKRVDDPTPSDGWLVFMAKSDHTVQFQFFAGGALSEETSTDQAFHGVHHIVIARSASGQSLSVAMYVDGVLQVNGDTLGSQGAEPSTNESLSIGTTWHGLLDEVAIYDHALSAERVLAHFQAKP